MEMSEQLLNHTRSTAGDPPKVVVLDDVHVRYKIAVDRTLSNRLRSVIPGVSAPGATREVHALKGINLTVRAGDRVGVIGHNGSGKSTLLAVIGGMLAPSSGTARAAAYPVLLGGGVSLSGELSGRRNIILGCTALGMSREEAKAAVPAILAFADVEDFADVPMRAYSAGMRARLQFAVATQVRPQILMIDEALSAGDQSFRKRTTDRIEELTDGAGAMILVSHSMYMIRHMCDRVLWINGGEQYMEGDPEDVTDAYIAHADAKE